MPRFLLITLAAPIASFGLEAGHERRGGRERPGKSVLLGLLGAALGIPRDDTEGQQALARTIDVGVRVDNAGTPLQDFHTAQYVPTARIKRPPTRAIAIAALKPSDNVELTRRDYRQDVLHTAAFALHDDCPWTLEELAAALRRPRFTLYLGRKSCPLSLPLDPRIVQAGDMLAALEMADPPASDDPAWEKKKQLRQRAVSPGLKTLYAAIPAEMASAIRRNAPHRLERVNDHPLDRQRWHFAERREAIFAITPAQPATQEDSP